MTGTLSCGTGLKRFKTSNPFARGGHAPAPGVVSKFFGAPAPAAKHEAGAEELVEAGEGGQEDGEAEEDSGRGAAQSRGHWTWVRPTEEVADGDGLHDGGELATERQVRVPCTREHE